MKMIEMRPPKGDDTIHVRPDKVGEMKGRGWKEVRPEPERAGTAAPKSTKK